MLKSNIETILDNYPEAVAKAKAQWQKAGLDREKVEAGLFIRYRLENPQSTATEIKALINNSNDRYEAVLQEISFEMAYNALYETLMAAKVDAKLRTAY